MPAPSTMNINNKDQLIFELVQTALFLKSSVSSGEELMWALIRLAIKVSEGEGRLDLTPLRTFAEAAYSEAPTKELIEKADALVDAFLKLIA
jgi:hypothetical protein